MHVVLNAWFWNQANTGSGQYIRQLTAALRKTHPDLALTLVMPPHDPHADDVPDGVEVVAARGFGGKLGKVWFEQRGFPQAVKRLNADLAHVPYWGPPLSSPVPLVVSVLDVIPLVLAGYSSGLANRLYVSLVTAAARGAAHIITLSEASKADIVAHIGTPAESVTPTYLAVDERYHPKIGAERDAEVRAKYNLPDRFILYMGGFDRRKNVDALMYAYTFVQQAENDRVPLVLAGREPQWGTSVFPDVKAYARELGIDDNCHWIGYVDEADKPALYRLADVFVYPSVYEGFGLPVLEALACGTPTVARDIPVMRELVEDGAYLVPDARQMGGAIIALLIQEPLRKAIVNQGLGRATQFSWRKTARETFAVYERVIQNRTRA